MDTRDGVARRRSRAEGRGAKERASEKVDEARASIFDSPMLCANKHK